MEKGTWEKASEKKTAKEVCLFLTLSDIQHAANTIS